ncbi:MAG: hemolysin family protein [Actinomycetota bacterium]
MTPTDWVEAIGVLLLLATVALMAASETAIIRTNRVHAYHLVEEGKRGATSLQRITESPPPYLNVVLLLTMLATVGGTTLAGDLAARNVHRFGEVIATVVMTLLLFVFAEVTPKTFAIQQTDRVALRMAPVLVWLARVFGPLARALLKIANVIMPGRGLPQGPYVTEQEIKTLAEVASDEEQIEEEEKDLIHSIFEFGDTIVREVMVPRPDIVAIEDEKTLGDLMELVLQHGYSRVPVFHDDLDHIVGIVYAKDVLKAMHQGKGDVTIAELARPARFVPESKKCAELLREMQRKKFHISLVTDEYGSISGLVTLEDLLEELVGEITDEYDREEAMMVPVGEGRYRVDGRIPIDDLNDLLDVELPQEEWDTVGGLMMGLLGAIPSEGQEVAYDNLKFKAERVQGRRIARVLVSRVPAPKEPSGAAAE